jgi:hypothetical protein
LKGFALISDEKTISNETEFAPAFGTRKCNREPGRNPKNVLLPVGPRYDRNARFRIEAHNESDQSKEIDAVFFRGFAET